MKRRDVNPELRRQLDAADAGQDIWVAFSLRFPPSHPPEPGETERQMTALIRRIEEQTGIRAGEPTVFDNLGTFGARGPGNSSIDCSSSRKSRPRCLTPRKTSSSDLSNDVL